MATPERHTRPTRITQSKKRADVLGRAARHAIESLESRVLLATDLSYDVGSSLTPFNATLTRAANRINLIDATNSQVLQSVTLADFSGNVSIVGSRRSDVLSFDPSLSDVSLKDVSVDGGTGSDTVNFTGNLTTYGGSIAINAESITVAASAGLSTWYGAGVVSTGDSGDISFTGTTIEMRPGSSLNAAVSQGSAFEPGDVKLEAEDAPSLAASVATDLTTPVLATNRTASITLTRATITGNDVDVSSTAETQTRWDELGTYSQILADSVYGLLSQVSSLGLSALSPVTGQVKIQKATATTTVTDSTINALNDASITSTAAANASFKAVGINHGLTSISPFLATIGFGRADAVANVNIAGNTVVTAARDINVTSATESEAETKSRAVGNGLASPTPSVAFAASLAVALTGQDSSVTTDALSKIESRSGNIAIHSTGEGTTKSEAETEIYQDGPVGLTVGIAIDQTKVRTAVNGTVIASDPQPTPGYTFNAATGVNTANETITLTGIDEDEALERGQQINYVPAAGQTPIGGLTAGATYVVADVISSEEQADGTLTQTIRLAKGASLDIDGEESRFNSEHTLSKVSLSTFDAAAVSKNAANELTLNNAALTTPLRTGDLVTYLAPNSANSLKNLGAQFTRSATGDTIKRTDGGPNFIAAGLLPGERITLANTGGSDGTYTIKSISDDGNTLTLVEANRLTAGAVAGFNLTTAGPTPTAIGGLTPGETYLAITDNNGVVRFQDPDQSGVFIKFSSAGAGLQGFTLKRNPQTFRPSVAIDPTADTIDLPNHGYQTGDTVLYHSDPNLPVTRDLYNYTKADPSNPKLVGTAEIADEEVDGLTDGRIYFVVRVDANTIRLAPTLETARDAEIVPLTSVGSGTQSFADPTQFTGVQITSSLEAENVANTGTELSGDTQSVSDAAIGATQNANDLLGLIVGSPQFLAGIAGAVNAAAPLAAALSGIPLKLAGTFSISGYDHDVETMIGSSAIIKSGADLEINSEISQVTQTNASAEPTRNAADQVDPTVTGTPRSQMELGVAFAHNTNRNTSRAIIDPNAVVDASGELSVESAVDYPPVSGTISDAFNPASLIAEKGVEGFNLFTKGDLGIAENLFNSTVVVLAGNPAAPEADLITVAGGFDIQRFQNEATARISSGAKINQDAAYQTEEQAVSVHATNSALLLNASHQTALNASIGGGLEALRNLISTGNIRSALTSIVNPLGVNGQNTAGPAVILNDIANVTTAEVGAGAKVRTGEDGEGLSVEAKNDLQNVDLSQTGANATSFGLSASVTVGKIDSTTTASIRPGATVDGGPVDVTADDTTDRIAIDGGWLNTSKAGIGASINQNTVNRNTQAFIGSPTDGNDDTAEINAPGAAVKVAASNSGRISAYAVAGTTSTEANLVPTPNQPVVTPPAGGVVGGFSFAAGASVAINEGVDAVSAFLQDAYVNAGTVSVTADADTTMQAVVVGGALGTGLSGIDVGVAGAFAFNDFSGDAKAFSNESRILAAGASGEDAVTIKATNTTTVLADGGGVSLIATLGPRNATNLSAGVGVGVNQLSGSALAYAASGSVQATRGNIDVEATYSPTIDATTIAGAGAVSAAPGNSLNIAGAGAGAQNVITGGAQAYLLNNLSENKAAINAGGNLSVNATNAARITADGGAFALALALIPLGGLSLTVGTSVAINQITSTTLAYIKDSTVLVAGSLAVMAAAAAVIQSKSLGGAASGGSSAIAAGGGGSGNTITDITQAFIRGGRGFTVESGNVEVQSGGALSIAAANNSAITADAGGFALAFALSRGGVAAPTISGGVSAAINTITTTTTAELGDIRTRSSALAVTADSKTNIQALTMAGAASGSVSAAPAFTFGGAGAGSSNNVTSTTRALISDINANDGNTIATLVGPVTTGTRVEATEASTILANGGAVALAIGLGSGSKINASFGASAANNGVTTDTTAAVDNAQLQSPGRDVSILARNDQSINALTVAGAGALAVSPNGFGLSLAGAGTGSGNAINETTTATIRNNANVSSGGRLSVSTINSSDITARAYAGSLAFSVQSGASLAIGAAIAKNQITNTDTASVIRSTATAAGNLSVSSNSTSTINAESVAAAVSVNALGRAFNVAGSGAGAQSINTINKIVSATAESDADLSTTAGGNVALTVNDNSGIRVNSAGGALGLAGNATGFSGAFAISAGLSTNNISNVVSAFATGAGTTINSAGGVTISAAEQSNIEAKAVSVAAAIAASNPLNGSVALAGAGGRADNTINATINAAVVAGAAVDAVNTVSLEANDTATARAEVPAVAVAVAPGISIASGVTSSTNTINDDTNAFITNARVTSSNGGVTLRGQSSQFATARTTPVAVSVGIGGSAQTGQTTTRIGGSTNAGIGTGAVVNAKGDVNVTAGSNASAEAISAGGGAGLLNIGIISADAQVTQTTRASVDGSVTAGNLNVTTYGLNGGDAQQSSRTAAASAIAGQAAGVGGQGVTSNAVISGVVVAEIVSGATVNVAGRVRVDAKSRSTTSADGSSQAAAAINVSVLRATAALTGGTSAAIGAGANVRAGSLDVTADATKATTSDTRIVNMSVIGGSGVNASAVDSVNTSATVDASGASSPKVIVSGAMTIGATSAESTKVTAAGGAGGGIQAGVLLADAASRGSTTATLAANSRVSAGSLAVNAATTSRIVSSDLVSGVIAIVGVNAVKSTASATGDTTAAIASGSTVTTPTNGSITVDADDRLTSVIADANGGSGGIVNVTVFGANAAIGSAADPAATAAVVNGNTTLTTGQLTVDASSSTATSSTLQSGAGSILTAINVVDSTAAVNATTSALIGGDTAGPVTINAATGTAIRAVATDAATAVQDVGAGGALAVATSTANSSSTNRTTARLGENTTLTGGSLQIEARNTGESATTKLRAVSIGGLAIQAVKGTAVSTPTVVAQIATGAQVNVNGDVGVYAFANGSATGDSESGGAGGVQVGVAFSDARYTPTAQATVLGRASIKATGSVTVSSNLSAVDSVVQPQRITAVDTTADTVDFAYPLDDGDTVKYTTTGTAIGGLTNGQVYNVVPVSNGKLRFGAAINAGTRRSTPYGIVFSSNINPDTDVIAFDSSPNLRPGDPVRILSGSGQSIVVGDAIGAKTYYVRPVYDDPQNPTIANPLKIRLAATRADALASDAAVFKGATSIANNRVTIPNNGFREGQPITYQSANSKTFASEAFNATYATRTYTDANGKLVTVPDLKRSNGNAVHTQNNSIVIPNHGFITGDAVTFANGGSNNSSKLTPGGVYFIIRKDANTVQLAQNKANALAGIVLTLSVPSGAATATNTLSTYVRGLTNGNRYYVTNLSGDSFQLSNVAGGPPIVLDASASSGTPKFGALGLDLQYGSGDAQLVLDLSSAGSGTQTLVAPDGGPLEGLAPVALLGKSSSRARGGSAGAIEVTVPTALLTIRPTVSTTLSENATINAGSNVSLLSNAKSVSVASANSKGAGFVSVGSAKSNISVLGANTTTRTGFGSTIQAGGNVTVSSLSDHDLSSSATSDGGGFVSTKDANDTSNLNGLTQTTIGGKIDAGGNVAMSSNVSVSGRSSSRSQSAGAGSFAKANDDDNYGIHMKNPSNVLIDSGSQTLGDTVRANAVVSKQFSDTYAYATSSGFAVNAFARAVNDLTTIATVTLSNSPSRPGTLVSGRRGVDIVASAAKPTKKQFADGDIDGIGRTSSGPVGETITGGNVTAARNALVVAGTRQSNGPLGGFGGATALALYVSSTTDTQWDANVTLTTADPVLVVGSNGTITSNVNVNATTDANGTTINSIASPASGQIAFSGSGKVAGQYGTFTFNNTFNNINITNNKGLLTLGDITAYSQNDVQPKVIIDLPTNALEFNVNNGFKPTTVNVTNTSGDGILLKGTINNPLGVTTLNSPGSIVAQNYAEGDGAIVTNQLFVNTGGSFGGTTVGADRVAVGIVEAAGFPARVNIVAAANLYAGLQAQNRNVNGRVNFVSTTSLIPSLFKAGGAADVLLEGAADYTGITPSTPDGGIQVLETAKVKTPSTVGPPATTTPATTPRTTKVYFHYRIDTAPPANSVSRLALYGRNNGPIAVTYNLGLVQAGTSINVQRSAIGSSVVNVNSKVDLPATAGALNVNAGTNGYIKLAEVADDLRVGLVRSTRSTVELAAGPSGSILDVTDTGSTAGDAAADVIGNSITLNAPGGTIGTAAASLDTDLILGTLGGITANAKNTVYLNEKSDSLRVTSIKSTTGDVNLESTTGGIEQSDAGTAAHVVGNTISLAVANTPPDNRSITGLFIDSSFSAAGGLRVLADQFVNVTETLGALNVLSIDGVKDGLFPNVNVATRDTAANTEPVNVTGPVRTRRFVVAAADDFTQAAAGPIIATGVVQVQVDPPAGDADAFGATVNTNGTITAQALNFIGGNQTDTFNLTPQVLPAGVPINVNGLPPVYPRDTDVLNFDAKTFSATRTVIDVTKGSGTIAVTGGNATVNYIDIGEVNLTERNDPPVNTLPIDFTTSVTPIVLSTANGNALQVTDPDAGNATNFQVSLTTSNGVLAMVNTATPGVTLSGTGTSASPLILRGTFANINAALRAGLRVTPTAGFLGVVNVTMVSNDNGNTGVGGALTDTDTLKITIAQSANLPPVNSLPDDFTSEALPVVLSQANGNAISVADPDAGAATNFQVSVGVEDGTLALVRPSGLAVSGTGSTGSPLVLTGSLANINTALAAGLAYTPTAGFLGTTTLIVVSNDRGNTGPGGELTDTDSMQITVQRRNLPPVNTLPGTQTTPNVTPLTFSAAKGNALSFADPDVDATATDYAVALYVSAGELAIENAVIDVSGDGTPASPLFLRGTLDAINGTLASNGVVFIPAENFVGPVTLTMISDDRGHTGLPGPLTDTDTLTINVTAVPNQAPVNTLPADFATADTTVLLAGENNRAISVSDVDAGDAGNFQVTLTPSVGTVSTRNADGVTASGAGTTASPLVLLGSLESINAVLINGLVYTAPDGFLGRATLTVVSNDNGNTGSGGAKSDTDVLAITIASNANRPPVNSLPSDFATSQRSVVLSSANGNAIQVADPDAGDATNFEVKLVFSNGFLSVVPTAGVTVTGDGSAGVPLTLTGTRALINAALAGGLTVIPDTAYLGDATLTVVSNDNGNTGVGGPLTDTDTMRITFSEGVNQAPVNHLPDPISTAPRTIVLSQGFGNALQVTDVDAGDATDFRVTITLAAGTLALNSSGSNLVSATGNGTEQTPLRLVGSLAEINATLLFGLTITPPAGFTGDLSLTIVSNDNGNTGEGGPMSDTDVLPITIVSAGPVNQPPVNVLPNPIVTGVTPIVLSTANGNAISVTDPDDNDATNFVVQLTPAAGQLALLATPNGFTVTGGGTATSPLTLTGRRTAINAGLAAGLRLTPPSGFTGDTGILIVSNDNGNTGSGGAKTDSDVLKITVSALANQPPINHLPLAQSTPEATDLVLSAANNNALSVTDADAANGNLTVTLTVPDGGLTLLGTANGVTVNDGAGTLLSPLVLTGTQAAINALLAAGLQFTPNSDFTGTTLLKMVSNDNGNTGTGGPLSDTDYLAISVVAPPLPGPKVVAVYADSNAWSPNFRDFIDGGFETSAANGYLISGGANQSKTLPWVNVNQIKVVFDQDVGGSLTAADFSTAIAANWLSLGVPVGVVPHVNGLSYDSGTFTATLSFDNVFPAAVIDLNIASANIVNAKGVPLDGEWANNTASASGDGVAGGDFSFRMFFLPGDTVDQSPSAGGSRTVNATDAQAVRNTQNGVIEPRYGAIGYDARADLDGSGTINATDSLYERNRQNATIVPLSARSAKTAAREQATNLVDPTETVGKKPRLAALRTAPASLLGTLTKRFRGSR